MVSRLDWRSSDAVHGQRQEKEEDAGDEGQRVAANEAAGDAQAGDGGPVRSQEVGR